jgi:hypothetical protein
LKILVISSLIAILIASNVGLYFLLGYLEQTNRIHYGYRVESTEYRENDDIVYFQSDDTGYLKIIPYSTTHSEFDDEVYMIERYNLNGRKLWNFTIFEDSYSLPIAFNEKEKISINLGEDEVEDNNQNEIKKQYSYSLNNNVVFNYTIEVTLPSNDTYDVSYQGEPYFFTIIDSKHVIIPDINQFIFVNKTDYSYVYSTTNVTLLYFDLENNIVSSSTIIYDGLFSELTLFKSTERKYYFTIMSGGIMDQYLHQKKYEVDLSFNELDITFMEEHNMLPESCYEYYCSYVPFDENRYISVSQHYDDEYFQFWLVTSSIETGILHPNSYEIINSWEVEIEPYSRGVRGPFYYSKNQFIFTEIYGEEEVSGKLMLFSEGSEEFQTFALHTYENIDHLGVQGVFRLNNGKIAIVVMGDIEDDQDYIQFSDIQILTISPKDFQGLLFLHPSIPHIFLSSLIIIIPIIISRITRKKRARKGEIIEVYPIHNNLE